jgi:hypothetical protein
MNTVYLSHAPSISVSYDSEVFLVSSDVCTSSTRGLLDKAVPTNLNLVLTDVAILLINDEKQFNPQNIAMLLRGLNPRP